MNGMAITLEFDKSTQRVTINQDLTQSCSTFVGLNYQKVEECCQSCNIKYGQIICYIDKLITITPGTLKRSPVSNCAELRLNHHSSVENYTLYVQLHATEKTAFITKNIKFVTTLTGFLTEIVQKW
jgi:hypothetical protein